MTHDASLSPEARRRSDLARISEGLAVERPEPNTWGRTTLTRVSEGVYAEGFVHAGNLAFMALLTLFPFFIVLAALAQFFGRTEDGLQAVSMFLENVPPSVSSALDTLGGTFSRNIDTAWRPSSVRPKNCASAANTIKNGKSVSSAMNARLPAWTKPSA